MGNKDVFEYDGLTYIPVRKLTDKEKNLISNRKPGEIWDKAIIEKPKNGESYSVSEFMQKAGKDSDLFYCIERGKFFTPNQNGIINLNQGKIDEHFRKELEEFYNRGTTQKIIRENRPLKFDKEKDIELIQNISSVLTEGEVFFQNNQTLGDIRVKYGNCNKNGLSHIIKRRMDKLTKHDGLPMEDAQKETSAILFLSLKNIAEAPATKETNGRYAIYKDGVKTAIDKDKQGRFVVTGFDFNDTKQEARDAIKSVNAQYGYTPEFLEIYAQVGAAYASLSQNISQSAEKSNKQSEKVAQPPHQMQNIEFVEKSERYEKILYKSAKVNVNGIVRDCKSGLVEGFKNAVAKVDELRKENNLLRKENENLKSIIQNNLENGIER